MLSLRIVVICLGVAAAVCGCCDSHLHLHDASREEVIEASMLTLFFGVMYAALGMINSKMSRK